MDLFKKRLLLAAFIAVLAPLSAAIAGAETPRVDQRQENQGRRIDQGVASGSLTPGEVKRLEAQQGRIENAEARAKADGVFDAWGAYPLTTERKQGQP